MNEERMEGFWRAGIYFIKSFVAKKILQTKSAEVMQKMKMLPNVKCYRHQQTQRSRMGGCPDTGRTHADSK